MGTSVARRDGLSALRGRGSPPIRLERPTRCFSMTLLPQPLGPSPPASCRWEPPDPRLAGPGVHRTTSEGPRVRRRRRVLIAGDGHRRPVETRMPMPDHVSDESRPGRERRGTAAGLQGRTSGLSGCGGPRGSEGLHRASRCRHRDPRAGGWCLPAGPGGPALGRPMLELCGQARGG